MDQPGSAGPDQASPDLGPTEPSDRPKLGLRHDMVSSATPDQGQPRPARFRVRKPGHQVSQAQSEMGQDYESGEIQSIMAHASFRAKYHKNLDQNQALPEPEPASRRDRALTASSDHQDIQPSNSRVSSDHQGLF